MCGSEEKSGLFCFAQKSQGEDNCYEDKKVLLALGDWVVLSRQLCCLAYSETVYLENSSGSRWSVWKIKTGKTGPLSRAYSQEGRRKTTFLYNLCALAGPWHSLALRFTCPPVLRPLDWGPALPGGHCPQAASECCFVLLKHPELMPLITIVIVYDLSVEIPEDLAGMWYMVASANIYWLMQWHRTRNRSESLLFGWPSLHSAT